MYLSRERKQLDKPRSCTRRMCSSGAPKGEMTRPRSMGLTGGLGMTREAEAGDSPWARAAVAARLRKCLRFIHFTIGQQGVRRETYPVFTRGAFPARVPRFPAKAWKAGR